ncbi:beta-galactosidase [Mucilaginibacter yixingensis]|uniref:Beta-galactosidase n=1 Tax=Mucilaginibacter yixingensis TaxID=1295612 RepID=A0A2T5JAK8_9SPHI|nr:glycoside hydrolase family 2 TIM barrel-domain containing protein [Mucilaginibacter yixingensis]PTQ97894.1 beta-galactosidase [Mucilaginibacter yixingensis]
MKNLLICFAILLSGQWVSAQQSVRRDSLLNFDWKFNLGDTPDAKNTAFNDKTWTTVQLPHDGSITGAFDTISGTRGNGYRPRHIGWYRKTFVVPANTTGKRIVLDFEGVYRAAEVWVNGAYLGKHLNGYTGFSYDVTRLATPGKPVTIAVRYDNTYKQSSRWYTGEGIYRNVWLRIISPVHVVDNGTYITTPFIADGRADVAIQTTVANQTDSTNMVTLKTVLIDARGKEIKSLISMVPLRAHEAYTYHQYTSITNPVRWDVASPVLYTAKTYVLKGNAVIDNYQTRFGIRTVSFSPEEGFVLNGRKVFLNGVNIHHDLGPLGSAAFDKGFRRRLLGLKQMGVNAIRLAHNPHAQSALDMCDELGILVFDESFDKWSNEYYGPGEDFHQHWQADLEWFIRRDRNHPSVFIWSVGNEVAVKQEYKDSSFVVQLDKMVDVAHRLDPSRKVTSGLYPSRDEDVPVPMAFHMDVMSDNYMARFYKRDHPKFPQLIFLESEMTTDNGGESFFGYDHSYACGQFYWGGTDYIGESFGWPSKGWNGIIDWCDFWKPISYYIKSLYSPEPMVKIAVFDAAGSDARVWNDVFMKNLKMTDSWNWEAGKKLTLYTFTTGDEVELFLNNKSVGIKQIKDFPKNKILWELNYEPGTIKAIARKNGKPIATDEIKTAGKAHHIVLKTDSTRMRADGLDLSYITVNIVDQNGILVPDAANDIQFDVKGAATIAGVANSNRLSDELFVASHRKAYEGKCLLVLRSGRATGKVQVKATATGLKGDVLNITVQ